MYVIAIRNPAQGIESTIAEELGQDPDISEPSYSRHSDKLAVVAYRASGSPNYRALHSILTSHKADYLVMSGDASGENTIDQIMLMTMATLAMNLTDYHREQAKEGKLPKPLTNYRMEIAVSETPAKTPENGSDEEVSQPSLDTYLISFEFPISHTTCVDELERIKEKHGVVTGVYGSTPGNIGGISEQSARLLIESISEHFEGKDET